MGLSTSRTISTPKKTKTTPHSPQFSDICASALGTFLGTTPVPDSYGNDLCFYAHLLLMKAFTSSKHKSRSAKIRATDESLTITQLKPNRILTKCSLEDLSYVWIHPKDSFVFGFIFGEKNTPGADIQFQFAAMRLTSKANIFAFNVRHIYCFRMLRSKWVLQEGAEDASALWVSRVAPSLSGSWQSVDKGGSSELGDREPDMESEGRKTSLPERRTQAVNDSDIATYTRLHRKSHSSINFTNVHKVSSSDADSEGGSKVDSPPDISVAFGLENSTSSQQT